MRTLVEIVRDLKEKPGRGGHRLSQDDAETVLRAIKAGALAVRRERAREPEPIDPVDDLLAALGRVEAA